MAQKSDATDKQATLTIGGGQVKVSHERVPIADLRADPNNPRLRFQIRFGARTKPESQSELLDIIREQPGYEELQKQIRILGGINDPLIIRSDGTVVEGNSRLAAVTLLHGANKEDERWQTVPVTRLPADLPEEAIELLMASFHIAGKTVWRPFAQADQIYVLIKERKVDPQRVAVESRMSKKQVENYCAAYEYLTREILLEVPTNGRLTGQAVLEKKFHHALEFIQRKELKTYRDDPAARKRVAQLIATDQITGSQVRTELPKILADKRASSALMKRDFIAAKEVLRKNDPTVDSKLIKALKKMTELLGDMDKDDIDLMSKHAEARAELTNLSEMLNKVREIVTPRAPSSEKRHAA